MPNEAIEDQELSFGAKGLLLYCLSKPDNWEISYRQLAKSGPNGEHSVRGFLQELRDAGYLVTTKKQGKDGRWTTESVLHEHRVAETTEPSGGNPSGGNPSPENHRSNTKTVEIKTVSNEPAAPDPANQLLRDWYDELKAMNAPVPAQPWPAMLQVVKKMLAAGHSPPDVAWALRNAPAVSTGALTFALNSRSSKTPKAWDALARAKQRGRPDAPR